MSCLTPRLMYGYKQWIGRVWLANLIPTVIPSCTKVGNSRPRTSYPRPAWGVGNSRTSCATLSLYYDLVSFMMCLSHGVSCLKDQGRTRAESDWALGQSEIYVYVCIWQVIMSFYFSHQTNLKYIFKKKKKESKVFQSNYNNVKEKTNSSDQGRLHL